MGSPAIPPVVLPPQQWRQTPPPTSATSAVRTAKRKCAINYMALNFTRSADLNDRRRPL